MTQTPARGFQPTPSLANAGLFYIYSREAGEIYGNDRWIPGIGFSI